MKFIPGFEPSPHKQLGWRTFLRFAVACLLCLIIGTLLGLKYGMHHAFDIADVGDVFFQEKMADPCILDTHNLEPACLAVTKDSIMRSDFSMLPDITVAISAYRQSATQSKDLQIVYFNWPRIEQCASDYLNGNASPWVSDDDKNQCNLLLAARHAGWLAANTVKPDPYPAMPLFRSDDVQKEIWAKQRRLQLEDPKNIGNYHNRKGNG